MVHKITTQVQAKNAVIEPITVSEYAETQVDILDTGAGHAQIAIYKGGTLESCGSLSRADLERLVAWGQAHLEASDREHFGED